MNKKILIVMLLGMFLFLPMVTAVPPFQSTNVAEFGLEIEATNSLYLPQNIDHTFHFRVYNASDGVYISADDVTCSFGILDNKGDYLVQVLDVSNVGYRFDVLVLGGNFSLNEVHHKGINCQLDDGTAGGVLTQSFEITTAGGVLTQPIVTLNLGLIFVLFLFFVVVLVGMFQLPDKKEVKDDGEIINRGWITYVKPVLFMLAYGLLMAIMFISSGVALNYLVFTALGKMLFVTYQIMMYALLPMIIVWLVWIFVSIFQDNEMKKMLERGGDDFGDI